MTHNIDDVIDLSNYEYSSCLNSWVNCPKAEIIVFTHKLLFFQSVTQSIVLTICISFLFLRIHFMLKLAVALFINVIYFYIVFEWFEFIYEVSFVL
jgi:hypothetical protein